MITKMFKKLKYDQHMPEPKAQKVTTCDTQLQAEKKTALRQAGRRAGNVAAQ